ncbi:uncharacterized protein LOC115260415 [Aedes albopictus]|uniref:SET domain-containing protein n=1 Tax=Aedes albopictus TaxID=7160 RepID=A0ABM1YW91_AEDAL
MEMIADMVLACYVAAHIEAVVEAVTVAHSEPIDQYAWEFFRRTKHMRFADVADYRSYVIKHGPFVNDSVAPDPAKNDRKAAEVRQVGNRLYLEKQYIAALVKYNESICWADGPDSEQLGIGYANRSAVFYDLGEYEYSLVNIDLAKKHNYPQRLMPKLLSREANCKDKIAGGHSRRAKPCHKLDINVETDAKRPFCAAGIAQKVIPGYGRSMVAERSFNIGDVILSEKAMLSAIPPELKFKNCNYCSAENFNSLIPCPKCVSVMYCDQECLEKGFQYIHRFECGICEKLNHVTQGTSRLNMGPRAFFYGFNLFGDNLNAMMSFCKRNGRTGGDPFTIDYSNRDPLEEFKIFHKIQFPADDSEYEELNQFYAAVLYSIYIKHPLVRSMFRTKTQKDFFLRSILDYTRIMGFLLLGVNELNTSHLYSLASVCNHSCDPNTAFVEHFGVLKLIVIRPISIDDQIVVSYGPLVWKHSAAERQSSFDDTLKFDCLCDACDVGKMQRMKAAASKLPAVPLHHIFSLMKIFEDSAVSDTKKMTMLQQFIKRYAYAYPRKDYSLLLDTYRDFLLRTFVKEVLDRLRATAAEQVA